MEIKLKTLTPIWTGGVNGNMDRIHETGILGSLRWWYEAIVRGLGGEVCDPRNNRCNLSGKKLNNYEKALEDGNTVDNALTKAEICDVCKLFGCTGWKRKFELDMIDDTQNAWIIPPNTLNIRPPNRHRGWYLPAGRIGSITLSPHGQRLELLVKLLNFLEQWGMLCSKPQLGYGVFQFENKDKISAIMNIQEDFLSALGNEFGFFKFRFRPGNPQWWTRLAGLERLLGERNFAIALQQLAQKNMVPVAPILKNTWRFEQWKGDRKTEQQIFGTLQHERIRSKIAVSWAYKIDQEWEVRGWVWLPEQLKSNLDTVRRFLTEKSVWCKVLKLQSGNLVTAGILK